MSPYLQLFVYLYIAFISMLTAVGIALDFCGIVEADFVLEWYDCWMGFYLDRQAHKLYVLWVPMVGISFKRLPRE